MTPPARGAQQTAASDEPAAMDAPASRHARTAPASAPPDRSSLVVTTNEDTAQVMLRDTGLTGEQGLAVSRLLALQMQQLGFTSVRTYVNGVARRLDASVTGNPQASAADPAPPEAMPRTPSQTGA
jgi:hypothetical protein